MPFVLDSAFQPQGDQPAAIESLVQNLRAGVSNQILKGVTGSGKTYVMAKVIEKLNRPTIVITHNKTLVGQLYQEFKSFFPNNAVEYFVSYYDYYQPEAYVPSKDIYIEKDASINEEIDFMRHRATSSLFEREDILIVASVSCIYGLGSPENYLNMKVSLKTGEEICREELMRELVRIQYSRSDFAVRGSFKARGDTIEIYPKTSDKAIRVELFGDEVERILECDGLTGRVLQELTQVNIFPAQHYVTPAGNLEKAIEIIRAELAEMEARFLKENKLIEAQRIRERTLFDLEMLSTVGYCNGIENYSRHLEGRQTGDAPGTLIDYLPHNALIFLDESHVTIPQLRGMYNGDRSRKQTLVEYGFRLPSALDNRPLKYEEFVGMKKQTVYVSATPGPVELENAAARMIPLIVRPTGLLDPQIIVRPTEYQVDDILKELHLRKERNERVFITTLTKKMAENLATYYQEQGILCRYMHSDIQAMERLEIIRELRMGKFDVLIGINLLREGLDVPEVSLVCVLDADKEGFLRSATSLIQISGRAARNINGCVIFYADRLTPAIKAAIAESEERRRAQKIYNEQHGIVPTTISKKIADSIYGEVPGDENSGREELFPQYGKKMSEKEKQMAAETLRKAMREAAEALQFEEAAKMRDQLYALLGQKKN
jgi:excinuclease ABC subunit B